MHIAGMILGCLLLSQTPAAAVGREDRPATFAAPTTRAGSPSNEAPAPSRPVQSRRGVPEMVADAARLPSGSTIGGQPLTLLNVLGSTPDRRQQFEMARAYWHLMQAVGEYRFCLDHVQNLGRLKPPGGEPASLRLARASAAAMLREAELEATGAQCELARLARLPAGAALPLPADQPYVGPYRTNFHELFAGRTPPEPTALLDRILPIRQQAIDDQAAAVAAAEDVLAAAGDQPQNDPAALTACSQELLRQRRALMRAVCDYNRNIAEYGLTVAGPATTPQALVAMLIGPAQQGGVPIVARNVRPTAAGGQTPALPPTGWKTGEPTLAPPRDAVKKNEPTLAPPRDELRRVSNDEPTLAPPRDKLQPVGKDEPNLAPPQGKTFKEPADLKDKPLVPVHRPSQPPSAPEPRTVNKPTLTASRSPVPFREVQGEGKAGAAASPLYPALLAAAPAARTKQLTVALHWDRSLPPGIGKPLSLADCLLRDPGADRRATIEAYWRVRQRAAAYQVLVEQAALLDSLMPVALERRKEPSGPAEMLRLSWAQRATQASLREAHAALVEVQYALALRIGATAEAAWPLASTIPHSGRYLLRLEAQPQIAVESWPVRRLAVTIPTLGESVQQHAAAVVEADAARVAAAEKYCAGGASIDQAIESITVQTQQTMAVLSTLTDYNQAIAEYVLAVMPPATPANKLVAALVVKP
jgi:hypothetical protein